MADITKIVLPNNTEYNLKDSGAVRSSQTKTIFVQGTTPSSSVDGDIWIDTSQDAIPNANGEEF